MLRREATQRRYRVAWDGVVNAMRLTLTRELRAEYVELFRSCVGATGVQRAIDRTVARMLSHAARYTRVAQSLGMPWQFIAILHVLESAQDFRTHLHNGDPLRARTVRVPAGRPLAEPPFTWESSAIDALKLRALHRVRDWSLASMLYRFEAYNGFGYRLQHPEVLSPYLWAGSNHYTRGKYVRDGKWSASAVSNQIGAAVLLRRLAEIGHYDAVPAVGPAPDASLVVRFNAARPRNRAARAQALALQRWLNSHPGIFLREDGWPGPRTAVAYRLVTGQPLPGYAVLL